MPDHDLEKLLGGFAADTLTAEEKQQLYRAALGNQNLFNALAEEQALKELLADPIVRRRLLQALHTTQAESAIGSASWFDWFRHPAGLAWAGGLAGAVLAVVLGTRVYQESLRQEAQSIAKEEARPPLPSSPVPTPTQSATPLTNAPSTTSEQKSRSSLPPRKEAFTGKTSSQAPRPHTTPDEQRTHRLERDAPVLHEEIDTIKKQIEPLSETLPTSTDKSAPQLTPPPSPPSYSAATASQSQSRADSPTPSQERASLSARSLFYGTGPQGQDKSMAGDTRRREKAASESTQSLGQSELTPQSLAMAKSNRGSPLQPLGIRYSLTPREQGQHSQDGATDTATPKAPVELTVESNQDGFLQVWNQDGSSNPQLLFPIAETDRPRSKLTAHTPLTISVPPTPDMLVIRFSRTDIVPSATFDKTLLNDSPRPQLRESVLTDEISNGLPPIHYVVNQDPSLSEIIVHIAPSQP